MNILKKLLPKKEALLNKENIMEDMPKSISKALYPEEVLAIHHEFETAADKLLKEATFIIKDAETKDINKISRLEAMGFKQVNQVVELKPLIQKAELSKQQIELINYYRKEYPLNKFITEDQVKEICHKYNLVCGEVSRFKGFVPEKNLREIENFKLKKKEDNIIMIEAFETDRKSIGIYVAHDVKIERKENSNYYHIYSKTKKDTYSFQQSNSALAKEGDFYGTDRENLFGLQSKGFLNIRVLNREFKICAPIKDMDISGLELTEGYKLTKIHIPDPVVLKLVPGGYLIVTAWGDEASDPLVVNEINN